MAQNLEEFLTDPNRDWETIKRLKGWHITHDGIVVIFKLSASDGAGYVVRLICDKYPEIPPSVFFTNEKGERGVRNAWPHGNATFTGYVKAPPNCFICADLTREGVQRHSNWKGIWNPEKHTLMDVFNFIHDLLNDANYGYQGRLAC